MLINAATNAITIISYMYKDTYICIDTYEDSLKQAGPVDTHIHIRTYIYIHTCTHIYTQTSAACESWIYVFIHFVL